MISRKDFFFSYTDGNAQFRHVSSSRRSDSDGPKFFPSPDGNAQIHPTCPKVARQSAPHFPPSRHVGSDSDRPKFFSPSPDGNAQILPTCPKVARQPAPSPHFQPSRHVGSDSDGTKFVSHLMAMLRFIRRVLKSPVSRPPHSPLPAVTSRHVGFRRAKICHSPDGNAHFHPTCPPEVARQSPPPPHFQPSRRVT